jgi:hypothetical protein
MSLVTTVYSTNQGMTGGPGGFNPQGGAVGIGRGTDGLYAISVVSDMNGPLIPPVRRPDGYTIVNREELRAIRDAIDEELARQ